MFSTVLAMALAGSAAQATDTTRVTREAFTNCLQAFVRTSVQSGKSLEAFRTEFPQQCTTQEAAFREAVIRRDTAMRATRASAEESANMEVEDARLNFADRFELETTPR